MLGTFFGFSLLGKDFPGFSRIFAESGGFGGWDSGM